MRYLYIVLAGVILSAVALRSSAQIVVTPHDTNVCNGPVTIHANVQGSNAIQLNMNDDEYSAVVPIGFTFNFYGVNYTQCVISSNGFISFNIANAGGFSNWLVAASGAVPGNPDCLNAAMGAFFDIYQPAGGTIYYVTTGTAPNRKFIVTFCDVAFFDCNNLHTTFQMVLNETSNVFESHIATKDICNLWPNPNPGVAIEGVQNAAGTAATTAPGRNWPATWIANHDAYAFTPSGPTYTVASIPYAPVPISTNPTIYWYNMNTGVLIAQGIDSITVNPQVATTYKAVIVTCADSAYDTCHVNPGVNAGPEIVVNPTCVGNNGKITITGLTPGDTLSLSYFFNNIAVGPTQYVVGPSGNIVLDSLYGGVYTQIKLQNSTGCFTTLPPDSLTYPVINIDSISWTNPSCVGHDGTITLYGLPPLDTTYVYYRNNGVVQPMAMGFTDWSGQVTIGGVDAGFIDSIVAGHYCFSLPVGNLTLVYPGLLLDSAHVTEPTQCGLTDGFITISPIGLNPGDPVVVTYYKDNVAQPAFSTTVDAQGTVVLANLGAGVYDSIRVSYYNCTSAPIGQYILNNPQFLSAFDYSIHLGCNGDTVIFKNNSGNGTSYNWEFGDASTSTATDPVHVYAAQGVYTITLHTFNGTCEKTSTHEVTLVHPVVSSFTAIRDSICEHQTVSFDGSPSTNAYRYVWDFGDGKYDSTNKVTVSHTYNTPGAYTAALTVYDFVPCPDKSVHTILVSPFEIHAVYPDTSVCLYTPMTIVDTLSIEPYVSRPLTFEWSPADFLDSPNVQQPHFYAADSQWHTYVVTMTSAAPFNCMTKETIRVYAQPHVHLSNITKDLTITYGQSVHLNVDGAYYTEWVPAKYLDNANIKDPISTPDEPIVYTVFGMNQYGGCRDTAYVRINLTYDDEFVPSAFTPNGDGKNDVFKVTNMRAGQKLLEFRVYDRWGQKVFETTDVTKGWDGTYNGQALDAAVFQYMIRISLPDGTQRVHKGDVTLLR